MLHTAARAIPSTWKRVFNCSFLKQAMATLIIAALIVLTWQWSKEILSGIELLHGNYNKVHTYSYRSGKRMLNVFSRCLDSFRCLQSAGTIVVGPHHGFFPKHHLVWQLFLSCDDLKNALIPLSMDIAWSDEGILCQLAWEAEYICLWYLFPTFRP